MTTGEFVHGWENDIQAEYRSIAKKTANFWEIQKPTGGDAPSNYAGTKLGLSIGNRFSASPKIESIHRELEAGGDFETEMVSRDNLHFTFLACSRHEYDTLVALPPQTATLVSIFQRFAAQIDFVVECLRLIPLPNALLLAGIPNPSSKILRDKLAHEILGSEFGPHLRARYGQYPIPPLIWHTTLLRHRRETLPTKLRQTYLEHRDTDFGAIHVGAVNLFAVSNDWGQCFSVGGLDGKSTLEKTSIAEGQCKES